MIPILILALAAPNPTPLKTFGDWEVGCDNGRACQAVGLSTTGGVDDYFRLVIKRDAPGSALPVLSASDLPAGSYTLLIDGKPVGRIASAGGLPFNRALASALASGTTASVVDARGRTVDTASLKGLAAAFLYIDEQQRRLGTRGALRRTGTLPDSRVPAPPPLPRVVQPATPRTPPRTVTPAESARLIGRDNAQCTYARGLPKPAAYRLDTRHSLLVVPHLCGNGAYNETSSVFIVDQAGRTRRAVPDTIVNGDWDVRTRTLSSYAKGRGLGDCGVSQDYAWDGATLRLVRQAQLGECRGGRDYITTWRATVVTR